MRVESSLGQHTCARCQACWQLGLEDQGSAQAPGLLLGCVWGPG